MIENNNSNYMNEFYNDEVVISVLEGPEVIRQKPGMYIGGTENPDVIFREIVDNAFDEVYASKRTTGDRIFIDTNYNGSYCIVADAGRGLPISFAKNTRGASNSHEFDGITQAELSCTKLHAGGKFDSDKGISVGTHGVGSCATAALSESYIILSKITEKNYNQSIPDVQAVWESAGPRSKKDLYYILVLERGIKVFESAGKLKEISNRIFGNIPGYVDIPSGYSTIVLFRPDPTIFDTCNITVPYKNLENFLLIQDKIFRKNVEIVCNGQVLSSATFNPYQFEMIKRIVPADTSRNKEVIAYITFEVDPGLGSKSYEGSLNALVTNRGVHIQYVESCFEQALKSEFKINHRYITNGLQAKVIFLAENFMFDSQTKTTLKSIDKTKLADYAPIAKEFVKIFRNNREYWEAHVDRLNYLADSMKSLSAVDKSKALVSNGNNNSYFKIKNQLSDKLTDATAGKDNRDGCELFITEGLSAASGLIRSRTSSLHHAILALRGRVKNVDGLSTDKMLENEELKTILLCMGLGTIDYYVGQDILDPVERINAIRSACRYPGGLYLCQDSDADGSIICAQLVYFFYKFAPFVIEAGLLHVMISPTYEQGGKYFYQDSPTIDGEIPVGIDTSKHYSRFKGLGSIPLDEVPKVFFDHSSRRTALVTMEGAEYACRLVESLDDRKGLLIAAGIITNPFNLQ